jgi:glutamate racemase
VVEADVDALLLGCTHYPYLARTISDVVGRDVVLVSSADETAFALRALLGPPLDGCVGVSPAPTFLTTGDVEWFTDLGSRLLGPELADASRVDLPDD